MAHTHEVLARQLWEAVAEGDPDRLRDLLSEEIVWVSVGRSWLSGEHLGPDGVLDYLARIGEGAAELSSTLNSVYSSDDGAVLIYHVSARRDLKRLEADIALILRFRDGQVSHAVSVPFDQEVNDEFWGDEPST